MSIVIYKNKNFNENIDFSVAELQAISDIDQQQVHLNINIQVQAPPYTIQASDFQEQNNDKIKLVYNKETKTMYGVTSVNNIDTNKNVISNMSFQMQYGFIAVYFNEEDSSFNQLQGDNDYAIDFSQYKDSYSISETTGYLSLFVQLARNFLAKQFPALDDNGDNAAVTANIFNCAHISKAELLIPTNITHKSWALFTTNKALLRIFGMTEYSIPIMPDNNTTDKLMIKTVNQAEYYVLRASQVVWPYPHRRLYLKCPQMQQTKFFLDGEQIAYSYNTDFTFGPCTIIQIPLEFDCTYEALCSGLYIQWYDENFKEISWGERLAINISIGQSQSIQYQRDSDQQVQQAQQQMIAKQKQEQQAQYDYMNQQMEVYQKTLPEVYKTLQQERQNFAKVLQSMHESVWSQLKKRESQLMTTYERKVQQSLSKTKNSDEINQQISSNQDIQQIKQQCQQFDQMYNEEMTYFNNFTLYQAEELGKGGYLDKGKYKQDLSLGQALQDLAKGDTSDMALNGDYNDWYLLYASQLLRIIDSLQLTDNSNGQLDQSFHTYYKAKRDFIRIQNSAGAYYRTQFQQDQIKQETELKNKLYEHLSLASNKFVGLPMTEMTPFTRKKDGLDFGDISNGGPPPDQGSGSGGDGGDDGPSTKPGTDGKGGPGQKPDNQGEKISKKVSESQQDDIQKPGKDQPGGDNDSQNQDIKLLQDKGSGGQQGRQAIAIAEKEKYRQKINGDPRILPSISLTKNLEQTIKLIADNRIQQIAELQQKQQEQLKEQQFLALEKQKKKEREDHIQKVLDFGIKQINENTQQMIKQQTAQLYGKVGQMISDGNTQGAQAYSKLAQQYKHLMDCNLLQSQNLSKLKQNLSDISYQNGDQIAAINEFKVRQHQLEMKIEDSKQAIRDQGLTLQKYMDKLVKDAKTDYLSGIKKFNDNPEEQSKYFKDLSARIKLITDQQKEFQKQYDETIKVKIEDYTKQFDYIKTNVDNVVKMADTNNNLQIQELQSSVKVKDDQIQQIKVKLQDKDKDIVALKSKILEQSDAAKNLTNRLNNQQVIIQTNTLQLNQAQKEVENLQYKIQQDQQLLQFEKQKSINVQNQSQFDKVANANKIEQLNQQIFKNQDLEQKYSNLVQLRQNDIQSATQQIQSLQSQLEEQKTQQQKLQTLYNIQLKINTQQQTSEEEMQLYRQSIGIWNEIPVEQINKVITGLLSDSLDLNMVQETNKIAQYFVQQDLIPNKVQIITEDNLKLIASSLQKVIDAQQGYLQEFSQQQMGTIEAQQVYQYLNFITGRQSAFKKLYSCIKNYYCTDGKGNTYMIDRLLYNKVNALNNEYNTVLITKVDESQKMAILENQDKTPIVLDEEILAKYIQPDLKEFQEQIDEQQKKITSLPPPDLQSSIVNDDDDTEERMHQREAAHAAAAREQQRIADNSNEQDLLTFIGQHNPVIFAPTPNTSLIQK